jgi:hypothetical protein
MQATSAGAGARPRVMGAPNEAAVCTTEGKGGGGRGWKVEGRAATGRAEQGRQAGRAG